MAKISLTVKQIMNLGIWDKVCEYKKWNPYILNEGLIDENEIVEFDDEFKQYENKMEKFVGDSWVRKDWEYTVVAKVPHAVKEGVYVYLVSQREFGTEEYDYFTEEY